MEPQLQKKITNRLHYIAGQANSIEKMFTEKRTIPEIFIQLLAIEGGIKKIIYQHFDDEFRKEIAIRINTLLETKKISRKYTQRLIEIKKQFPVFKLRQLPKIIFELQQIENTITA